MVDTATDTSSERNDPHSGAPPSARLWQVLVTFATAGTVALALLLILWFRLGAAKDTLEYELAKICMQVLAVAVVGGVITFATSTFQQDREARRRWMTDAADRKRERAEAAVRDQRAAEERRAADVRSDMNIELERQRQEFEITSRLLNEATLCAQAMYVACQHVRRAKDDDLDQGSLPPDAARTIAFAQLHRSYLAFNARARAIQDEIGARTGGRKMRLEDPGSEAFLRWHQIYDLLTAYYFHLAVKNPSMSLRANSRGYEGKHHSGLDLEELTRRGDPRIFRNEVRRAFEATMETFTEALLADASTGLQLGSLRRAQTITDTPSLDASGTTVL